MFRDLLGFLAEYWLVIGGLGALLTFVAHRIWEVYKPNSNAGRSARRSNESSRSAATGSSSIFSAMRCARTWIGWTSRRIGGIGGSCRWMRRWTSSRASVASPGHRSVCGQPSEPPVPPLPRHRRSRIGQVRGSPQAGSRTPAQGTSQRRGPDLRELAGMVARRGLVTGQSASRTATPRVHPAKPEGASAGPGSPVSQYILPSHARRRPNSFSFSNSFDEIPAVMDADERSWLVLQLSEIVARVARGGKRGRGLLASRPFRRPRFTSEDQGRRPNVRREGVAVLELRPFNDTKIAAAIDRAANHPEAIKRALFRERPDLASIARTPFMLGLMIDFWEAHPGRMPGSQAELYESFVARSLVRAKDRIREQRLSREDVLACASAIAREMFDFEPAWSRHAGPAARGPDAEFAGRGSDCRIAAGARRPPERKPGIQLLPPSLP